MAKKVTVRYVGGKLGWQSAVIQRDMTVGNLYRAEIPEKGDRDPDGTAVMFDDELWITKDDAGDHVVTRLKNGFELIAEH